MVHLLLAVIYLAFISPGLPDSLLGSAWPSMYGPMGVPVSFAGILSMLIAAGTIVSSLLSDRLTRRFGAGRVTAVSVLMTAAALLGFSCSGSYAALCVWALPYGLGAGSVDAALNNYVALQYASRHMSWLHCMWGVGASLGPYIMGAALTGGHGWQAGYRAVGLIQTALAAVLLLSLPLWRQKRAAQGDAADAPAGDAPNAAGGAAKVLTLREAVRIPGAPEVMAAFFCYCALEQTAGLWAGSYLVLHTGLGADEAASLAGLFYAGITVGRALGGFATLRFSDTQMIRLGQALVLAGVVCLLAAPGRAGAAAGLALVGLGCAPIYPAVIHSTPARFGAQRSQAMIGLQMASAYVGTCVMPAAFGVLANHISAALLPAYLLAVLAVMALLHERLVRKTGKC